jgi:hypothetical protein
VTIEEFTRVVRMFRQLLLLIPSSLEIWVKELLPPELARKPMICTALATAGEGDPSFTSRSAGRSGFTWLNIVQGALCVNHVRSSTAPSIDGLQSIVIRSGA